jgi:hypothetical protein
MVPPNGAERQQNTGFISEGIKLVNQPHPARNCTNYLALREARIGA